MIAWQLFLGIVHPFASHVYLSDASADHKKNPVCKPSLAQGKKKQWCSNLSALTEQSNY